MQKFLILVLLSIISAHVHAADGYDLWLRPASDASMTTVSVSGVKSTDPTVQVAVNELHSVPLQRGVQLKLKKSKAHSDSYTISTRDDGSVVIQAPTPRGLLYGACHLVRLARTGHALTGLDISESPAYDLRILNHWDNLDGTVERGYAGNSIWKWNELPDVVSDRYAQYGRACASIGVNGAVLNNVNASPRMLLPETLAKVRAVADALRPYGIRTYLSINFASPKVIGGLPTADPVDPRVIEWWRDKVDEIYGMIPDFGGFLVKANSEGEPGPGDYGRSHAVGANMLADAVARHGGVIMWRAFVYNPTSKDRAKQAFEEFVPLDGQFRDNVIIQIKNGPIDFQPREPFSPLFGAMPGTQQMVEFQITQEYLGASNHLVYLAPLFSECLGSDTYRGEGTVAAITSAPHHGVSAIAGVANIGDDANWCGHDFAQANWYAFGRLAWNPALSPDDIAHEWLAQTFTLEPAFVTPVKRMMMDSREAAVNYMMPIGLHHIFAENHHYGPQPWFGPAGMRPDWTPLYYHKATADSIGFDRTVATGSGATRQYADPLYRQYESRCPVEYALWFNRHAWTDKLDTGNSVWHEMCNRYSRGVEQARGFQRIWDSVERYVDPERFAAVQDKLKIQTHDAQWWKDACLLYFQSINGLPFPPEMERPVYRLDNLMEVSIPLRLHGCPTRDMLP